MEFRVRAGTRLDDGHDLVGILGRLSSDEPAVVEKPGLEN